MATVAARKQEEKAQQPQKVKPPRSLAKIDADITHWDAEREKAAREVQDLRAAQNNREAERKELLRQKLNGDSAAVGLLAQNDRSIHDGSWLLKDAEETLRIIVDETLPTLATEREAAEKAFALGEIAELESESRAVTADAEKRLTAVNNVLTRLDTVGRQLYSARHDFDEKYGRDANGVPIPGYVRQMRGRLSDANYIVERIIRTTLTAAPFLHQRYRDKTLGDE